MDSDGRKKVYFIDSCLREHAIDAIKHDSRSKGKNIYIYCVPMPTACQSSFTTRSFELSWHVFYRYIAGTLASLSIDSGKELKVPAMSRTRIILQPSTAEPVNIINALLLCT